MGTWGGRGERGAATLEHVGLSLLVASLVTALVVVPVAPTLVDALRRVVCQITGGGCAAPERPVLECTTGTTDRTLALSATAYSVVAGTGSAVSVLHRGDGTAQVSVTTTDEVGARAQYGGRLEVGRLDGEGRLGITGSAEAEAAAGLGGRLLYEFPDAASAETYAAHQRGSAAQVVDVVAGVNATGAREAVAAGLRALGVEDDWTRAPDAVAVRTSVVLSGGAGVGIGPVAGASADGRVATTGELVLAPDGTPRTSSGTVSLEGGLLASATLPASLGSASAGASAATEAEYAVDLDDRGEPTTLTLTATRDREARGEQGASSPAPGRGPDGEGGGAPSGEGSVGAGTGTSQRTVVVLDLRTPANRAAFDAAFVRAGPVVTPRSPAAGLEGYEAVARRIARDGVVGVYDYETTSATTGLDVSAGDVVSFGGSGSRSSDGARLTGARAVDMASPGGGSRALAGCS